MPKDMEVDIYFKDYPMTPNIFRHYMQSMAGGNATIPCRNAFTNQRFPVRILSVDDSKVTVTIPSIDTMQPSNLEELLRIGHAVLKPVLVRIDTCPLPVIEFVIDATTLLEFVRKNGFYFAKVRSRKRTRKEVK
jgi:hypothetical protein